MSPLPQKIPPAPLPMSEVCALAERWTIDQTLAAKLCLMAHEVPFGLTIISGYRTKEEQDELRRQGRPAADDALSTHRACPATGADLWPDIAVTDGVKALFGAAAIRVGLRWGGGSRPDPNTGVPSDWNHVDLGPRSAG